MEMRAVDESSFPLAEARAARTAERTAKASTTHPGPEGLVRAQRPRLAPRPRALGAWASSFNLGPVSRREGSAFVRWAFVQSPGGHLYSGHVGHRCPHNYKIYLSSMRRFE